MSALLKRSHRRGHHTLNELNITPLLDLVFVLLVIFIITTPQLVNNLEMFLPSGKPPPSKPAPALPSILRIVVDATGQVFVDDQAVSLTELRQKLIARKTEDPDPRVVVKGHNKADYQYIISVLDILQQLEITKVGLATDAP